MSTSISIGFSQLPVPAHAALQACVQVKNQLNRAETDLIILFATPSYAVPEIQEVIARTLRPKRIVGSSTRELILSHGIANRGIAIIGINSDELRFGISGIADIGARDMHTAGFDLARQAMLDLKSTHREVFIHFSQGIEQDASKFIHGIREVLGIGFPVLGAIASDDFKYKNLYQFYQNQVLQNSGVGLLLGGSFHLAIGCSHGFKPLGKPRFITKIDGHIIRTIDNKPAIDIYEHFLGKDAQGLKNTALNSYATLYPLGVYLEEDRGYLLRNVIDILQDGSIVCHGGVHEGAEVHLMISNKDSCQHSAMEAAETIKASLGDKQARLVLIFESLARHKILGNMAFDEVQAVKNVLGFTTPLVGMCSFGEVGPFRNLNNIKNIHLHNESILILALA